VLALFDVFHEQLSDPAYRGCAFVNAAAECPHHEGIQAVIAYHREWLPGLFRRLPQRPSGDDALIAALVQLTDGAITAAHLARDASAAATARSTAALLLVSHLGSEPGA
jgi:hypothetical protein